MTFPSHIRHILITGATGGFGRAFAYKFLKEYQTTNPKDPDNTPLTLYLHGRDKTKLETLCRELESLHSGPDAIGPTNIKYEMLLCDLDNSEDIERTFNPAKNKKLAAIDVLINNAGGALGLDKAQDSDLRDWDQMIDRNVRSLAHITKYMMDAMVARRNGYIINISSVAASWPYPGGHIYCASKAFVRHFSLALRADLLGTNVRVTSIEPGLVETEFSLKRFKGDAQKADAVYANTRPLKAEDIADITYYAMSLPQHVNISTLEVLPTDQANGPLTIHRANS